MVETYSTMFILISITFQLCFCLPMGRNSNYAHVPFSAGPTNLTRPYITTLALWSGVCFRTTETNTDTAIGCIGKCMDDLLLMITVRSFLNQKPWVNGRVCAKLKNWADNTGDLEEYRKFRYVLRRATSCANRQYRYKVESNYLKFVVWTKKSYRQQKENQQC